MSKTLKTTLRNLKPGDYFYPLNDNEERYPDNRVFQVLEWDDPINQVPIDHFVIRSVLQNGAAFVPGFFPVEKKDD